MSSPPRFRLVAILACLSVPTAAVAQAPTRRVEVGFQISALRLTDFDATNIGFGGRAAYDLADWAGVEGEVNFYPNEYIAVAGDSVLAGRELRIAHHRRRAEAFFGPTMGLRKERIGVFAKIRPGFTRVIHREMRCVGAGCALVQLLLVRPVYRTEFALDLGGVLEVYPSSRTVVRLDLGDSVIRHRSQAPPCWAAGCTSHNFASRIGVGVRF